jgi:hypothetical protein
MAARDARRADFEGVRFIRVIDHPASSRKEMRSAALAGSQAEQRTSTSSITATTSVKWARMRRPIRPESPGGRSAKEADEAVTPGKLTGGVNSRNC